jgi:hypothetical protein
VLHTTKTLITFAHELIKEQEKGNEIVPFFILTNFFGTSFIDNQLKNQISTSNFQSNEQC